MRRLTKAQAGRRRRLFCMTAVLAATLIASASARHAADARHNSVPSLSTDHVHVHTTQEVSQ